MNVSNVREALFSAGEQFREIFVVRHGAFTKLCYNQKL